MLLHPRQRQHKHAKNIRLRPELTAQVLQYQPFTRETSGIRRALAGYSPSIRWVARGYAKEFKARQLMLQVPSPQRLTRSTSDRPRTTTGAPPDRPHTAWLAAKRPSYLRNLGPCVRGRRYGCVRQAFQPAGCGDFPVATAFDPADGKVRFTGRQECLLCGQGRPRPP